MSDFPGPSKDEFVSATALDFLNKSGLEKEAKPSPVESRERGKEFLVKMITLLKEYPEIEIMQLNTGDLSVWIDDEVIYPNLGEYGYGADDLVTTLEQALKKLETK